MDPAKDLLKKTRLRLESIHKYFQFLLIRDNKERYLKYFDEFYRDKLSGRNRIYGVKVDRYVGFRKIFEELLNKKTKGFTIIETGCSRGFNWPDGNSSLLFFEFLNIFGGKLISIDINRENMDTCREILRKEVPKTGKAKFLTIVGDSVEALNNINEEADLLYLDSFDFDINDPEPSMRHHLAELRSAKNIINKSEDLLLAVDDHFKELNTGKSKYVLEWARNTGQSVLSESHQVVMKINNNNIYGL